MSQNIHEASLLGLIEIIDEHANMAGLVSTRCLFTTTLVMEFASRMGFEACRWEGSVVWYNRKYVDLRKSGYDFQKLAALPKDKQEKRFQALEKRGLRSLHCLANEGDPERDLGGHVCVIAKKDDEAYFIDPTVYQFQREPVLPHRPGRIETPRVIVARMDVPYSAEVNFMYPYQGGIGVYQHAPMNRYRALLGMPDENKSGSDLNPKKNITLYRMIEKALDLKDAANV